MPAKDLIDAVVQGSTVEDVIDEEMRRTGMRPRKRRFGGRGAGVNPLTGKRKDPRRRLIARKSARQHKSSRRMAARKFARSAKGKQFHKKQGRLVARIRRR